MHMATRIRPWTRADLARLPDDGNRYEVLDGELFVTPQSRVPHQYVATGLAVRLAAYCERHALGVVVGPGAVPFGKNELQPDVQVVPVAPSHLPDRWEELPLPTLVVEVLSESTGRRDRGKKRDAYVRLGIPEYWIVDIGEHAVTVVRPDRPDELVAGTLPWHPRGAAEPLTIDLAALFEGLGAEA